MEEPWTLRPPRLVGTLTHTEPPGFAGTDALRDLAGSHSLLEQLEGSVNGKPIGWSIERWHAHRDRYAAKLG